MRRKDREITDQKWIEEVLEEGKVCFFVALQE